MYSVCTKKASPLHSVFDDTFNKTFSPCFIYMFYVRPVCTGQMLWVISCLIVSLLKSEKQQNNSNKTNTYTQCPSYTTIHENDSSCFFSISFPPYSVSLLLLLSRFLSFFLSLLCRHTHRTHTLAHSVRNMPSLYTTVACAETDTGVMPCYNLYCCQNTGVLSLSFHSTGHTWNRDTA